MTRLKWWLGWNVYSRLHQWCWRYSRLVENVWCRWFGHTLAHYEMDWTGESHTFCWTCGAHDGPGGRGFKGNPDRDRWLD